MTNSVDRWRRCEAVWRWRRSEDGTGGRSVYRVQSGVESVGAAPVASAVAVSRSCREVSEWFISSTIPRSELTRWLPTAGRFTVGNWTTTTRWVDAVHQCWIRVYPFCVYLFTIVFVFAWISKPAFSRRRMRKQARGMPVTFEKKRR